MIKHIAGSVTFSTPPITLTVDYQPQTGITAVVGPNGSGKSFAVIELVRYLLYGKAALRGKASDYKTLTALGTFTIRGKDYTIERSPKREQLTDRDSLDILAVGPAAVTDKVTELMGYGLAVFDIANASVQKQTDNFGAMPPAERKRMIDRVVGMTSLEAAEKACRDESKALRREAEALERTLPVLPVVNDYGKAGRRLAVHLAQDLEEAEAYDLVKRRLRPAEHPERPSGQLPTAEALSALEGHQSEAEQRLRKHRELDAVMHRARIYVPDAEPEDQLLLAEKRNQVRHAIEQRGPAPQFPAAEAERYWAQHAVFDAYKPSPEIECPNCQHHFHVTGTPPPTPLFSKEILRDDDARRARHAAPEPALSDGPDLTEREIAQHRAHNKASAEHDAALAEKNALVLLDDRSAELAAARAAQAEWAAHSVLSHAYDKIVEANADIYDELSRMEEPVYSIESLRTDLADARKWEAEWVAYDQSVIRRADLTNQIAEKIRMADQFTDGAKGVGEARTEMKAFLTPALSRAASRLITDMTHGKLSEVFVSEDMEITVNGQRIETLSGGGETVANIALRIALGQVLVKDTFPVFIGDEMDADADDERREAVLQSMVSLKDLLDQIIIVTHRGVEVADHVIDMQNTQ